MKQWTNGSSVSSEQTSHAHHHRANAQTTQANFRRKTHKHYAFWMTSAHNSNQQAHTYTESTDTQYIERYRLLLVFVAAFAGLAAAVGPVGGWDGVNWRALLAGRVWGMRRVWQAGSRLTCVVVKLHQAENLVCGDELELVGWVGDDIPVNTFETQYGFNQIIV